MRGQRWERGGERGGEGQRWGGEVRGQRWERGGEGAEVGEGR